jgi:hypothetical protein
MRAKPIHTVVNEDSLVSLAGGNRLTRQPLSRLVSPFMLHASSRPFRTFRFS